MIKHITYQERYDLIKQIITYYDINNSYKTHTHTIHNIIWEAPGASRQYNTIAII